MAEPEPTEQELFAWIDGELPTAESDRIARVVAAHPALAARAEAHRQLGTRLTAAFAPIAAEPVALPPSRPAPVVSLAAARGARVPPVERRRRWTIPGSIAASLVVGLLIGQAFGGGGGIADRPGALALSGPIGSALDRQHTGEAGPVQVALSFRDRSGAWCRSFSAQHFDGVACRSGADWRLRYASPASGATGAYRMAGEDPAEAAAIEGMMEGEPLDAAGEQAVIARGWR